MLSPICIIFSSGLILQLSLLLTVPLEAYGFNASPVWSPRPHVHRGAGGVDPSSYRQRTAATMQGDPGSEGAKGDETGAIGSGTDGSAVPPMPQQVSPDGPNFTAEQQMKMMGTSPRRIFLSLASSTCIALGANFFGSTSLILGAIPESIVESSGLDSYYPRGDFKRYRSGENGYSFAFPKSWVGDQSLELEKARRRAGDVTLSMNKNSGAGVLPDAAFGPLGKLNSLGVSQSDENVSVIVSKFPFKFSLKALGTPEQAAKELLRLSLAPEGSGRTAELIAACEENRGLSSVYQFEYNLDRGDKGVPLKAISIISGKNPNSLITMTVVAPLTEWENDKKNRMLRKVSTSFKLTK